MIISTTIHELERVWYERKVYFEADSIEEAKQMTAEEIVDNAVEFCDSDCLMGTAEIIDVEIPDYAEFKIEQEEEE